MPLLKPVSIEHRVLLNRWALMGLRFYQTHLRSWLLSDCRFYPSCSEYAVEAFEKGSFLSALRLVIKRILKCRPFGPSGYDPVRFEERENCCK